MYNIPDGVLLVRIHYCVGGAQISAQPTVISLSKHRDSREMFYFISVKESTPNA